MEISVDESDVSTLLQRSSIIKYASVNEKDENQVGKKSSKTSSLVERISGGEGVKLVSDFSIQKNESEPLDLSKKECGYEFLSPQVESLLVFAETAIWEEESSGRTDVAGLPNKRQPVDGYSVKNGKKRNKRKNDKDLTTKTNQNLVKDISTQSLLKNCDPVLENTLNKKALANKRKITVPNLSRKELLKIQTSKPGCHEEFVSGPGCTNKNGYSNSNPNSKFPTVQSAGYVLPSRGHSENENQQYKHKDHSKDLLIPVETIKRRWSDKSELTAEINPEAKRIRKVVNESIVSKPQNSPICCGTKTQPLSCSSDIRPLLENSSSWSTSSVATPNKQSNSYGKVPSNFSSCSTNGLNSLPEPEARPKPQNNYNNFTKVIDSHPTAQEIRRDIPQTCSSNNELVSQGTFISSITCLPQKPVSSYSHIYQPSKTKDIDGKNVRKKRGRPRKERFLPTNTPLYLPIRPMLSNKPIVLPPNINAPPPVFPALWSAPVPYQSHKAPVMSTNTVKFHSQTHAADNLSQFQPDLGSSLSLTLPNSVSSSLVAPTLQTSVAQTLPKVQRTGTTSISNLNSALVNATSTQQHSNQVPFVPVPFQHVQQPMVSTGDFHDKIQFLQAAQVVNDMDYLRQEALKMYPNIFSEAFAQVDKIDQNDPKHSFEMLNRLQELISNPLKKEKLMNLVFEQTLERYISKLCHQMNSVSSPSPKLQMTPSKCSLNSLGNVIRVSESPRQENTKVVVHNEVNYKTNTVHQSMSRNISLQELSSPLDKLPTTMSNIKRTGNSLSTSLTDKNSSMPFRKRKIDSKDSTGVDQNSKTSCAKTSNVDGLHYRNDGLHFRKSNPMLHSSRNVDSLPLGKTYTSLSVENAISDKNEPHSKIASTLNDSKETNVLNSSLDESLKMRTSNNSSQRKTGSDREILRSPECAKNNVIGSSTTASYPAMYLPDRSSNLSLGKDYVAISMEKRKEPQPEVASNNSKGSESEILRGSECAISNRICISTSNPAVTSTGYYVKDPPILKPINQYPVLASNRKSPPFLTPEIPVSDKNLLVSPQTKLNERNFSDGVNKLKQHLKSLTNEINQFVRDSKKDVKKVKKRTRPFGTSFRVRLKRLQNKRKKNLTIDNAPKTVKNSDTLSQTIDFVTSKFYDPYLNKFMNNKIKRNKKIIKRSEKQKMSSRNSLSTNKLIEDESNLSDCSTATIPYGDSDGVINGHANCKDAVNVLQDTTTVNGHMNDHQMIASDDLDKIDSDKTVDFAEVRVKKVNISKLPSSRKRNKKFNSLLKSNVTKKTLPVIEDDIPDDFADGSQRVPDNCTVPDLPIDSESDREIMNNSLTLKCKIRKKKTKMKSKKKEKDEEKINNIKHEYDNEADDERLCELLTSDALPDIVNDINGPNYCKNIKDNQNKSLLSNVKSEIDTDDCENNDLILAKNALCRPCSVLVCDIGHLLPNYNKYCRLRRCTAKLI